MLSREEYEAVIRVLLVELNHLCINASEDELQKMPRFSKELPSYLDDLRDPTRSAAETLYTAFALLDEYIAADWQRIAAAGYDAYVLSQNRNDADPKQP
jgi:hypothetical protein